MHCHEFEGRLHRLLDDRQSPEADTLLAAHAAKCRHCGQLLVGQRLLLAGLQRGVAANSSSELTEQVVAAYRAELVDAQVLGGAAVPGGASRRRRAWQVLAWIAATAAAVAIAVSIYLASQPRRPDIVDSPPKTRPHSVQPFVAPGPGRGLAHSDARPRDAQPRSAQGRRGPALAGFPLLPPTGYGVTLADMATSSIPQAVERIEEVERYAPGIRPIRISFSMLWNAIWRSIPGFGPDDSDPQARHGRLDARRLV